MGESDDRNAMKTIAERLAFEVVVPNPDGDEALNVHQVGAVLRALSVRDLDVLLALAKAQEYAHHMQHPSREAIGAGCDCSECAD